MTALIELIAVGLVTITVIVMGILPIYALYLASKENFIETEKLSYRGE